MNLDEEALAKSGGSRLPDGVGQPLGVIGLDDGAVMLELQQDSGTTTAGDGSTDYKRSDLVARRMRRDGTTVWSTVLGTAQAWFDAASHQSIASDGRLIWVVWPRFDGTLPATYEAMDSGTIVRSTLDMSGSIVAKDELTTRPPATQQIGSAYLSPLAVAADGTTAVGIVSPTGLQVQRFGTDGRQTWVRSMPGAASENLPYLAIVAGQVIASFGNAVVSWNQDGSRRWVRDDTAWGLAPIQNAASAAPSRPPVVVISSSIPGRDGVCALDRDGNALFVTAVESTPTKGWWTDRGLLLLDQVRATGTEDSLAMVDQSGKTTIEVSLAGSGDIAGQPGSSVADVGRTSDGSLLAVGSEAGYRPGTHDPSTLENWRFLWLVPSPAGDGDLSSVPTSASPPQ